MINQIPVALPVRIVPAGEEAGDVFPLPPALWGSGNHSGSEASGDRDLDLLAVLDSTHEFRSVLAEFSEADGSHLDNGSTCATPLESGDVPSGGVRR